MIFVRRSSVGLAPGLGNVVNVSDLRVGAIISPSIRFDRGYRVKQACVGLAKRAPVLLARLAKLFEQPQSMKLAVAIRWLLTHENEMRTLRQEVKARRERQLTLSM